MIHHPDDVKRVLVTNHRNYTKGVGIDRVRLLLGDGIMTSEGEFWRRQRRMMQPAFHRKVIERFAGVIRRVERSALLERWEAASARGEPVNVTQDMSELTLTVILHVIFGEDLGRLVTRPARQPVHDGHAAIEARPALRLRVPPARHARARDSSGSAGAPPARRHFDFMQHADGSIAMRTRGEP